MTSRNLPILTGLLAMSLAATIAWAQTTRASKPEVAIKVVTEDRQKQIQATVTLNGKPLEGVAVSFFVQRTFGQMAIGQDKTLEDGTAAVPFPPLPGGPTGRLQVSATTTAPPAYSGGHAMAAVEGARVVPIEPVAFQRALWAPRAPVLLVVTIVSIVVAVWGCYVYVAIQLSAISQDK